MVEAFCSIGNIMKTKVRNFLYTPGRERLCGFLATAYVRIIKRKFVRIFFDDGVWVHQYRDGAVTDRVVNSRLSLEENAKNARDWWFFNYSPRPGDVIFDIGSGKGEDTYLFSKSVGPTGKVVSIEAHPQTFQCLLKFCKYNDLQNVVPLDLAICDKETEVAIDNPDCDLFSTIVRSGGGQKMKGVALDALVSKLGIDTVDFIKMNIEGAERMAIQGMGNCIKKTRYICISCHDFLADEGHIEAMRTKKFILEFLRQNGFKIISRENDKRSYIADQINATNENFSAVQK